jgi:GLPGLI family protein
MMKKTTLFLMLLGTLLMVSAQQSDNGFLLTGSVIYEQIVKLDIQLEGEAAQMAGKLPSERKSEKILYFTEDEALFENHQGASQADDFPEEESGMVIKMYEPNNKTYLDLEEKKVIEQQEFMSRTFLIESDMKDDKWKLTGNQKTILEYACQEAYMESEDKTVHAWFTPEIPVSVGPGDYSNLPGLILALEINDGDKVLRATEVLLKPVSKSLLQRPEKGKKVTHEEFSAIVEEKLKEMGVESGGEGGRHATVVIKIQQ